MIADGTIYIPFAELVDLEKEIERLKKEEKKLTGEIKRCEGMLGNPNFVEKAPEKKIAEEREKRIFCLVEFFRYFLLAFLLQTRYY